MDLTLPPEVCSWRQQFIFGHSGQAGSQKPGNHYSNVHNNPFIATSTLHPKAHLSHSMEPTYNKPEKPGIWMNFDNTVSLYHVVQAQDSFHTAAQAVFQQLKKAQHQFPDWPRVFYLDIFGHSDPHHGFENDFIEFQQEFWFSAIAPFLTGFDLPLTGALLNPAKQRNNLPDTLVIQLPANSHP